MYDRLRARGWTEHELSHLKDHFSKRHEARFLVIATMVLLALTVIAIPYGYGLLAGPVPEPVLLTTLLLIAIPLGAVFGILLVDLDRLDHRHHLAVLLCIPVTALIGAWVLVNMGALMSSAHNALIGGLVYAVGFIAPYAFLVKKEWTSRNGR